MIFTEDVEMTDAPAAPFLNLSTILTSTPDDSSIRSPRTPTYTPSTLSLCSIRPFDPTSLLDTPLSPTPNPPIKPQRTNHPSLTLPPPPATPPLSWVWQCHLCRSRWPIGATRRCLVDGHYYCSGETDRPNLKKKKKGQSCSSEFDYVGWRKWGEWKRKALKSVGNTRVLRGCDRCEFPSQCRYSKAAEVERASVDVAATAVGKASMEVSFAKEGGNGSRSRFYTSESVNFEALLAEAAASTSSTTRESKADSPEPVTSLKSDEDVNAKMAKKGSSSKAKVKRPSKKGGLSPVEEEILKGSSPQDLVMPIVEFWNDKKINMKPSS